MNLTRINKYKAIFPHKEWDAPTYQIAENSKSLDYRFRGWSLATATEEYEDEEDFIEVWLSQLGNFVVQMSSKSYDSGWHDVTTVCLTIDELKSLLGHSIAAKQIYKKLVIDAYQDIETGE